MPSATKKSAMSNLPRVIIIGGGLGGIMTAMSLKKKLQFTNFTIYEQSDDLGGTWNWNTYPGCASDINTHWYSLSTDLNPDWDQTHVFQPELKAYWKGLAEKYDIVGNVRLHTKVVGATWDNRRQLYCVQLHDVQSGRKWTEEAQAIVSATGVVDVPYYPEELKGIYESFKGEHFHSARWNHRVDLQNKRVAVIGNGCSASQFVPMIAADPTTQVVSFCRTPNWILPAWKKPISPFRRMLFKYTPFLMRLYRWSIVLEHETMYFSIIGGASLKNKKRDEFAQVLNKYRQDNAPKEYHDRLKPNYEFGCKRFVIDSGYYEALHLPNNDLNFDGIKEVTEKGVLTKKGEHFEFDVIISATGFVVDQYPIPIRGSDGITIQQYYREHDGPTAYRGTTIPGFPNFFTVHGPNTATGHGSVIFSGEVQVTYIVQVLEPVLKGLASSFEVTHEATDAWNERIQKKLETSVWSGCQSWYRVGHTGKNSALWPGPLIEQWWLLWTPEWNHYHAEGAAKWKARQMWRRVWKTAGFAGVVAAFVWGYLYPQDVLRVVTQCKDLLQTLSVFHCQQE